MPSSLNSNGRACNLGAENGKRSAKQQDGEKAEKRHRAT
jgi:hypothetical protein